MSSIAIVGAGQAGLQLAFGLLADGHQVTVVTNRTGEDVARGRVMSSQCMFDTALATERELGLDLWDDEAPPIEGIGLTVVGPDGRPAVEWFAELDAPARSVDQRVKMPRWMAELERRGGTLRVADVGVPELEELAAAHDLVLVASGKGEIGRLFERDEERSAFRAPQRALALTYVEGYRPREGRSGVTFNLLPGVGEYFWFPALTTTGPCHILVFEGIPGGPMDVWRDVAGPQDHLDRTRRLLEEHFPWEAERATAMRLTDDLGVLAGGFPPTVRRPVATLPSGAAVLGMGDVVVLNDPITGQGSNNAAKCATAYREAIAAADGAYDRDWMEAAFAGYWARTEAVVGWTSLLLGPPAPHVVDLLGAAQARPDLARRIANAFDDARTIYPAWSDAAEARALLDAPAAVA